MVIIAENVVDWRCGQKKDPLIVDLGGPGPVILGLQRDEDSIHGPSPIDRCNIQIPNISEYECR